MNIVTLKKAMYRLFRDNVKHIADAYKRKM